MPRGDTGDWRGFDYAIQAMHAAASGDQPIAHYGRWLAEHHPEHLHSFAGLLQAEPGGDTLAPETKHNPIPREWYHTDWVADRAVSWLDSLRDDEHWFCWMSFPDPHHPWDPPASEMHRVRLAPARPAGGAPGRPRGRPRRAGRKPAHWLAFYEGRWPNMEGGPAAFVPGRLTDDQVREINAKTHVMNELVDEACGRVLAAVEARGWGEDTDVVFTTDHGELQGDMGLLYKGPFHIDALMRLPLIWRPAPSAGAFPPWSPTRSARSTWLRRSAPSPASTPRRGCRAAPSPAVTGSRGTNGRYASGTASSPATGCTCGRSTATDGCAPSTSRRPAGQPNGLERTWGDAVLTPCSVVYEATEQGPGGVSIATGELYHLADDPHQWHNRFDDPALRALRDDLVADLYDHLPTETRHLLVDAPA